jgi:hypothetical protein
MRAIFLIPTKPPPHLTEPEKWSPEFNDFVRLCLAKNSAERPSAAELISHPFVAGAGGSGAGGAGSGGGSGGGGGMGGGVGGGEAGGEMGGGAAGAALLALMESAAEPLAAWRKKAAEQMRQTSSAELQHATPPESRVRNRVCTGERGGGWE